MKRRKKIIFFECRGAFVARVGEIFCGRGLAMIIRVYPTDGLKGQQTHRPGHRPGSEEVDVRPERAKASLSNNVFALTGREIRRLLPRAMPWAGSSLPLRGAIG